MVSAKHSYLNNPDGDDVCWKRASLQDFVPSMGHAGDFAPSCFSTESVHRIAILDMHIVNLDRNDGNLLVAASGTTPSPSNPASLIPIDHGSCLPDEIGATA